MTRPIWRRLARTPGGSGIVSTSLRRVLAETLLLVYYEGMTYNEVADRVGAPLGTVKSWVRRSLVRLKGCMER